MEITTIAIAPGNSGCPACHCADEASAFGATLAEVEIRLSRVHAATLEDASSSSGAGVDVDKMLEVGILAYARGLRRDDLRLQIRIEVLSDIGHTTDSFHRLRIGIQDLQAGEARPADQVFELKLRFIRFESSLEEEIELRLERRLLAEMQDALRPHDREKDAGRSGKSHDPEEAGRVSFLRREVFMIRIEWETLAEA